MFLSVLRASPVFLYLLFASKTKQLLFNNILNISSLLLFAIILSYLILFIVKCNAIENHIFYFVHFHPIFFFRAERTSSFSAAFLILNIYPNFSLIFRSYFVFSLYLCSIFPYFYSLYHLF